MTTVPLFAPQEQLDDLPWLPKLPPEQAASGAPTGFWENLVAGYEATVASDLFRSQEAMLDAARERRRKVIEDITGKNFDELIRPFLGAAREVSSRGWRDWLPGIPGSATYSTYSKLRRVEDAAVKFLLVDHPQLKGKIPVTDAELRQWAVEEAQRREAEAADVASRGTGWWNGLARMLGGMGAALTDPPNIIAGLLSGGAETVPALVGSEMLLAGGASVATLPNVAEWRAEMGRPMDAGEMLGRVTLDTAAAGTIALGLHVAGRGVAKAKALLRREAKTPEERTLNDAAAAEAHLQENNPLGETPQAEVEHARRLTEAQRAAAEARKPDVPDDPVAPPPATKPVLEVGEEAVSGEIVRIDPRTLHVDAQRFQFKSGADAQGVTDRLAGVERWRDDRAGVTMVWEAQDGSRYIADGHQRLGLARRLLEADPDQEIMLTAVIYRETDGYSAETVRAMAAAKNIAEGTGTALDAAKVLRDAPEVGVDLPPTSALVRDAKGLAQLSDDAFMLVVNGKVKENHAAIVGRLAADRPEMHLSIMEVLAKHKPASAIEAESMVRDALHAPAIEQTVRDLFGEEKQVRVLYAERAKVLSWAVRHLKKDRQAFNTLVKERQRIEGAGNRLEHEANVRRAEEDAELVTIIQKLAHRKGPVADALARAAEDVAGGTSIAEAGRAFLRVLRERAAGAGTGGRAAGSAGRTAEGTVEGVQASEGPRGGRDAATNGENAGRQLIRRSDQPPPEWRKRQRKFILKGRAHLTLEALYEKAPARQKELEKIGRRLSRELGVEFRSVGVKARETAAEKMRRKKYKSAAWMTDVVRAGFVVKTPAQAEKVVAALARHFDVLDKGWAIIRKTGYFDRKVLVRFADGTVGEIQLWEPHLLKAKEDRGHALYRQARALPSDDPRKAQLEAEMRELYSAALEAAGKDWATISANSSLRSAASGKVSQNSSSASSGAVYQTSSASTSSQPLSSSTMAQARRREPSSTRMAGRASQSVNQNFMGDTSDGNLGELAGDVKAMEAELRAQAQEEGDLELPWEGADGETAPRKLSDLLDEVDAELREIKAMKGCKDGE